MRGCDAVRTKTTHAEDGLRCVSGIGQDRAISTNRENHTHHGPRSPGSRSSLIPSFLHCAVSPAGLGGCQTRLVRGSKPSDERDLWLLNPSLHYIRGVFMILGFVIPGHVGFHTSTRKYSTSRTTTGTGTGYTRKQGTRPRHPHPKPPLPAKPSTGRNTAFRLRMVKVQRARIYYSA